jgi:hypothetical protein
MFLLPSDSFNYIFTKWLRLKRLSLLKLICFTIVLTYSAIACIPSTIWKNAISPTPHMDAYKDLFTYIKNNIPKGYNIYSHFDGNGAGECSSFHRIKYREREFVTYPFPEGYATMIPIPMDYFDTMYEFCQEKMIMYALFVKNEKYRNTKDARKRFEYEVSKALKEIKDPRFILKEKFPWNERKCLYLYEIRSKQYFSIVKAIQEKRWNLAWKMITTALEEKMIPEDFAEEKLEEITPHIDKQKG